MHTRALLAGVASLVALALPGCKARESTRNPTTESTAAAATPTPWYSRGRALDLTGDGLADSIHLEARGTRLDSLHISLALFVAGQEKHREEWGSSYELALADSSARTGPRVDDFLRAQLDTVLASVALNPIGKPGARLMAEDSAALAQLDSRPRNLVSFAYGYETTVRLVWDAPRARFVRLWSCC